MEVEWGIGGLNKKCRCFMKRFDSTQPKFAHLCQTIVIFINFIEEASGPHIKGGWGPKPKSIYTWMVGNF